MKMLAGYRTHRDAQDLADVLREDVIYRSFGNRGPMMVAIPTKKPRGRKRRR